MLRQLTLGFDAVRVVLEQIRDRLGYPDQTNAAMRVSVQAGTLTTVTTVTTVNAVTNLNSIGGVGAYLDQVGQSQQAFGVLRSRITVS